MTKRLWVIRKLGVGRLAAISVLGLLSMFLLVGCNHGRLAGSGWDGGGIFFIIWLVLALLSTLFHNEDSTNDSGDNDWWDVW